MQFDSTIASDSIQTDDFVLINAPLVHFLSLVMDEGDAVEVVIGIGANCAVEWIDQIVKKIGMN